MPRMGQMPSGAPSQMGLGALALQRQRGAQPDPRVMEIAQMIQGGMPQQTGGMMPPGGAQAQPFLQFGSDMNVMPFQGGVPGGMPAQAGPMTPGQNDQMMAQLQQEQMRLAQMPQDPRIAAMAAQRQGQRMAPSPFQGAKGSRSTQPQMQQSPMTQYYSPMAARTPSMALQARTPSPAAPVRAPVQTPRPGGAGHDR
jgi:hypothetical protein